MMKTLALFLALALSAAVPASATSIQVLGPTADPIAGQSFTITIQALDLFDGLQLPDLFIGFGFDVVNTPGTGSATFQSVVAGPDFLLASPLPSLGTDVVGSTAGIANPAMEPVILAILTFMAGTPGTVDLGAIGIADPVNKPNAGLFYSLEADPYEKVLDVAGTTTINVQAAAVPEAFSFGLPLGLMALVGARRFLRNG